MDTNSKAAMPRMGTPYGRLPLTLLHSTITDCWLFVGAVPEALAYVSEDGAEPTRAQLDAASQCGPAFAVPRLRKRTWSTRAEALAAAAEIGAEVQP